MNDIRDEIAAVLYPTDMSEKETKLVEKELANLFTDRLEKIMDQNRLVHFEDNPTATYVEIGFINDLIRELQGKEDLEDLAEGQTYFDIKKSLEGRLSALDDLSDDLWLFQAEQPTVKLECDPAVVRGACKVFMTILMSKMWERLQDMEMPIEKQLAEVTAAGNELRDFFLKYTGIDTRQIYREKNELP